MRFIVETHGIRGVKDAMSRFILGEMDKAGIGIAATPYEITRVPSLETSVSRNTETPQINAGAP